MTIAADARYRTVSVSFLNNLQDGSELVQLLAKPSGGAWAAQRTFPVAQTDDQEEDWSTALPLYAYDIALRYLVGSVPATGYESSDPDAWTASTAAGSKGTVTTGCADVSDLAGTTFSSAATPITLTWSCAQLNVPFLIEKNIGAGWVTVVADLVATSYQYTIPGAELGGTTQFRVTPKRGAVAGTTSAPISVLMVVVVGAATMDALTFDASTGVVSASWNTASNATTYLVEKRINAGAWSTLTTTSGLSTTYSITAAEENKTFEVRVTGQNGAVSGATSAPLSVATTMTIGITVVGALSKNPNLIGPGAVWRLGASAITPATSGATSYEQEWSQAGAVVSTTALALGGSPSYTTALAYPGSYGITFSLRVRGVAAGPSYGPWSASVSISV